MVVALAALVVGLGGTSYAVIRLPANSVGSKQLKRGAVARVDVKGDAINSAKVATDSLTGADVNEASLGQVPSAASAGAANSAAHATATGALDKIAYRIATKAVPPADPTTMFSMETASAGCDAGQLVASGGVKMEDPAATSVIDTYPDASGRAWTARVDNSDETSGHNFTVYAVCIPALAAG
jgi:hypothetical protein